MNWFVKIFFLFRSNFIASYKIEKLPQIQIRKSYVILYVALKNLIWQMHSLHSTFKVLYDYKEDFMFAETKKRVKDFLWSDCTRPHRCGRSRVHNPPPCLDIPGSGHTTAPRLHILPSCRCHHPLLRHRPVGSPWSLQLVVACGARSQCRDVQSTGSLFKPNIQLADYFHCGFTNNVCDFPL